MKWVVGKPRQGRGLRKQVGAFWKWLECDARAPLQGRCDSLGARLGSFLLPPSPCPLPAGKNRQTQQKRGRATSRPALLFLYHCYRKNSAGERLLYALRPARRLRRLLASWASRPAARGASFNKALSQLPSLRVSVRLLLLRLCAQTWSEFCTAPKGPWTRMTNLPWIQLARFMVKIRSRQFEQF